MTTGEGGLPGRLTGLVAALRSHGLRFGPGETVDAAEALRALGLDDRERVRDCPLSTSKKKQISNYDEILHLDPSTRHLNLFLSYVQF
ncbi:hypothetical protein RMO59_41805, partial [Streptomyces alfalfae]